MAAAKDRSTKLGNPTPGNADFQQLQDRQGGRQESLHGGPAAGWEFVELIQPLFDGELAGLSANAVTARGGKWTARSVLKLKARRA